MDYPFFICWYISEFPCPTRTYRRNNTYSPTAIRVTLLMVCGTQDGRCRPPGSLRILVDFSGRRVYTYINDIETIPYILRLIYYACYSKYLMTKCITFFSLLKCWTIKKLLFYFIYLSETYLNLVVYIFNISIYSEYVKALILAA